MEMSIGHPSLCKGLGDISIRNVGGMSRSQTTKAKDGGVQQRKPKLAPDV